MTPTVPQQILQSHSCSSSRSWKGEGGVKGESDVILSPPHTSNTCTRVPEVPAPLPSGSPGEETR